MSDIRKIYTDDEMACRVWETQRVKDLMSLRSFYVCNEWRRRELNELWVRDEKLRKTASFGTNHGYYTGMDSISNYYVVRHNDRRYKELREISVAAGLEVTEKNLGFGALYRQPVATPLVQLAGDGMTARGLWYSIGCDSIAEPDGGLKAYWVNCKIAADFVLEDGQWRIWHLVESMDMFCEAGKAYADQPVEPMGEEDLDKMRAGQPDISMLTHNVRYNWLDDYPGFPRPYQTYSDENSYGPKGHPLYKEAVK